MIKIKNCHIFSSGVKTIYMVGQSRKSEIYVNCRLIYLSVYFDTSLDFDVDLILQVMNKMDHCLEEKIQK